jgi:hypothetical protein
MCVYLTVGKIVLAGYTGNMGEDNYTFEDLMEDTTRRLESNSKGMGRVTAGTGNQDAGRFAETHLSVFNRREIL